jgi:hypothetical protein
VPTWRRPRLSVNTLFALAVAGAAIWLAGLQYQRFLAVDRSLWDNGSHDRNAHYLFALQLATDLQHGRLVRFLVDLDSTRVWSPLHGVLVAAVLLVGGNDYRLAVLPSLAAFAGTVVLGFLVARRAVPRGGTVAGIATALFIAASPSHHAFATDIMLESTGACLTLAVLYCYLVAVQDATASAGRWLGLALTALFLEKYNYWLLAVIAITACTVAENRRTIVDMSRRALIGLDWRGIVRAEVRQPLNHLLAMVLLLVATVLAHGARPFLVGSASVSLFPPHNIVQVAYVIVFIRLVRWWLATGRDRVGSLPLRVRQVMYWHAWPVAVWLLLPKRIGNFLWYLGPWNAPPDWKPDRVQGIVDYSRWATNYYHPAFWAAVAAAILFAVAAVACRRLRPGGAVALWLVLVAATLSISHANRKARLLHTWIPAAWAGAGIGLAALTHGRLTAGRPRLRRGLSVAAPGLLAVVLGPSVLHAGRAPEGGPHPVRPSLLDLTDSYLSELSPTHRLAVVSTLGIKPLVQWTYLERFGTLDGLENLWWGFGPVGDANRQGFRRWLEATDCDTIVTCESLHGGPWGEEFSERSIQQEMHDVLPKQSRFNLRSRHELPHLNAVVTVWKR